MDEPTKPAALTAADIKKILEESTEANRDELKSAIKEAVKEWLTEMKAAVGTWTIKAAFAVIIAWAGYTYLTSHGWIAPKP